VSERFDVLVAGEYYCDLIFSGLDRPPLLGGEVFADGLIIRPGGCYNMALGLTRLGLRTAWACDFGTDRFSGIVRDAVEADGIDASGFREVPRSLQQVSVAFSGAGERGFITYREGVLRAPDMALVDRLRPRWLLQTFRLEPDWMTFMRAAKAAGVKIFGDCNGEGANLDLPAVRQFIGLCDVFSPNEAEALALTEASDVEAALARLAGLAPLIVIKRGANGVTAMASGRRYDVPAPDVVVVDTVGAGDAFAAGFLAGAIAGSPIEDQLRGAVACGSLSTTGPGSSANPSAAELAAFMTRLQPTPSYAAV
jgi:sugar/nucleoside kinase (ribokinase family)